MTTRTQQPDLQIITQARRTDLVRAVLQDDSTEIATWHAAAMSGGGSGTRLYRVKGEAQTHGTLTPWSFVVKIFDLDSKAIQADSAEPAAWNYWKREWLVYQADWLLQDVQGCLVPPRCLGVGEQAGIAAWIALEDLSNADARPWPLARFRTVARHLGVFNGAYLTGRPIPTDVWLSRDWLRGWTGWAEPMIPLLLAVSDNMMVRRIYSDTMIKELLHLWEERNAFFDALDALPQTLCHQDIFPRNVFVRQTEHGDQSVVVDWAFTGQGAIGAELAALVGASLNFFEADPARAGELEAYCLEGYLEGLYAAGWQGDPADVGFGYLASLVLRFGVGVLAPVLPVVLDEGLHGMVQQIFGRPMNEFLLNTRATMDFVEQRIGEARRLLACR